MKKLKLSLSKMKGAELLTREQLKKVMGGSDGGSGWPLCKSGACTLAIQGSDGSWVTRSGTCAMSINLPIGGGTYCYCDVGLGDDVQLSSNGGVSRCTN